MTMVYEELSDLGNDEAKEMLGGSGIDIRDHKSFEKYAGTVVMESATYLQEERALLERLEEELVD